MATNPNSKSPPLEPNEVSQSPPIIAPVRHNKEGLPAHNRIPTETREQIAREILINQKPIIAVAAQYGIDRDTASAICKEYFCEFISMRNLTMAGQLDSAAAKMLERIQNNIEQVPLQQAGVIFGILFDKRQKLIEGMGGTGDGRISLRIAWKDGSGAVELSTGRNGSTGK